MFIRQNFRLYPNKAQSKQISQWMGQARYVWNKMLEKNIEEYDTNKKFVFAYSMNKLLTEWKKEEDKIWLKECPSQVLQQKCQDLDTALKNKFKYNNGFPKFKSKNTDKTGIRFPQGVTFSDSKIMLPKMKSGIKLVKHREFLGEPGAVTITCDAVGDFYASVLVKVSDDFFPELVKDIKNSVGIDVGLKTFVTLSDGTTIDNPRFARTIHDKMKKLQRRHVRKQRSEKKNSNNREKARIKVAKLHRKIARQRKNFINQNAALIAKEYDLITVEDLNVAGMMKNHKLARSIQDVGFTSFLIALEWQCKKRGKHFHKISRWFPSSKTCSECGSIKQDLTLADRVYHCHECGHEIDRDLNAAINIDNLGREKYDLNNRNSRLSDMMDSQNKTGSCNGSTIRAGSNIALAVL